MGAVLAGHRFIEPRLPDPLSMDSGSALASAVATVDADRQRNGNQGTSTGSMLRSILPSIVLHGALIAVLIPAMTGSPPMASPPVMIVSLATLAGPSSNIAAAAPPADALPALHAGPQSEPAMAPSVPAPKAQDVMAQLASAPASEPAKAVTQKPSGANFPADSMAELSPLTHAEAIDLKRAEQPKPARLPAASADPAKTPVAKPVKAKPQAPTPVSKVSSSKPVTAQPASRPVEASLSIPPAAAPQTSNAAPTATPAVDNKAAATQAASTGTIPAPAAVATAGNAAPGATASAPVVITDPNYAGSCHYKYPESARRRNLQGTVVIRALIDTDGKAASVTIISSSGFDLLDTAARRAISDCAFTPQRVDGRPVQAIVDVPIPFKLI